MAIELGAAYISILPSTDKLAPGIRSSLASATPAAEREGRKAGKAYSGGLRRVLGRTARAGLFGLAGGASFLAGSGVKTAAELEQSKIGFETMLGSAKKADSFLSQIKKTAAATPFELAGLTQSSQKLLAFGFDVKKVIPTLLTLGDAASGLGVGQEGLDRIILAVGQIQAKGKVQSDELLQLTENGIPALKILANGFHTSTAEMQKMVTKGLVPANKAIPLLLNGIEKGTKGAAGQTAKFGGLMEKQSKSLSGLWSTFHDTLMVGLANAIEPLLPTLKRLLTKGINKLGPALQHASTSAQHFFKDMKEGNGTAGAIADTFVTVYKTGKALFDLFNGLPGPVKKFGLEALAAYLILRKVQGAFAPTGLALKAFSTDMQTSEGRMSRLVRTSQALGGALRQAAGVGGMLLLADSTKRSSASMSALEAAAGGALSGAALGAFAGPVGAAVGASIGGIAGAGLTLWHNTKGAGDAAKAAMPKWQDYASTLNDATAATTAQTKAMVFQRLEHDGVLKATRNLGISDRQAVAAVLGNVVARKKLLAVMSNTSASGKSLDAFKAEIGALDKARETTLDAAAATKSYAGRLKDLPLNLKTEIQLKGIRPTTDAVAALKRQYDLTPKQVVTLMKAAGVPVTKANFQSVITKAKEVSRTKATPSVKLLGFPETLSEIGTIQRSLLELFSMKPPAGPAPIKGGLHNLLVVPTKPTSKVDGARALGGPVSALKTYLVGENGPELFTASSNGHIIPNHSIRSGSAHMAAQSPTSGGRSEFVIRDWHKGTGYFRQIAEDTYDSDDGFNGLVGRMG